MLGALDRYFRNSGCSFRIIKNEEFTEWRKVLNGKAIELREMGKGKRKNKADVLTKEEEEIMWSKGVLGDGNLKSLNYTIFYMTSQQFGTRGRQEHHQICIEDLKFVKNPGLTKTRQGGLCKKDRRVPQRMFAVGGDRCPVHIMKKLISKRPASKKKSGPLYLTPLQNFKDKDVWYTQSPVGINQIDRFMKSMTNLAGLDTTQKNFTSHGVRKTLVQKLQKSGISKDKIASITSHRSEQSLRDYADTDSSRDYADTDIDDHAKMSKILSLSSHPSQPSQESSLPIKTLCHIYNLHAMYHFRFLIFTLHTLLVYPHPNNVFNGCNFYFGSSTSTSTQLHATNATIHRKRHRAFIESDDSD